RRDGGMFVRKLLTILGTLALPAYGACVVSNSNGRPATPKGDALYRILASLPNCPTSAQALKARLQEAGLAVQPSQVGNRGFHNPSAGSFSFFETVTGHAVGVDVADGDFFFGHFTGLEGREVVLDQTPEAGKLLVELIAF